MRRAFFIILCIAGAQLLAGSRAPAQEERSESARAIETLRVAWRNAASRVLEPERLRREEERLPKSIEKSIKSFDLSPEQAEAYRVLTWKTQTDFYRSRHPRSTATGMDYLRELEAQDASDRMRIRNFSLALIELLSDRQRALFRAGLEEARARAATHLNETRQRGPGGTSDRSIRFHQIRVHDLEQRLRILDELIEFSRTPSAVVEHDHLSKQKQPTLIVDQPDDASFRSANVVATGRISDDKLKWRLETELDRIQQRYDLIASQIEAGRYDHARRNIELLRQALPAAGQLVAQVQAGGDACEVLLIGLPTDAAMARIAELKQMRAQNLQHFDRVQADLTQINDDLFRARTEYINEVWRVMTRNLFEWHSPPAWYEVPQTFKDWHDQSKGQADKILTRQQVIQNLQELEKYLRKEMRNVLDRHRHEIVDKLNPLEEPVSELDSLVQSVVSTLDWTRWTPGERGK